MTNAPKRLAVKFRLKRPPRIEPADIVPIFQRWIQERALPGMLIDVIDYKHVPEGPGVILIADEGDYAYDLSDGETGLNYIRKRALPVQLEPALRLTFRHALTAARLLEAEAPDALEFDYAAAKVSILDRLHYRNETQVYESARTELEAMLSRVYGCPVALSRASEDPRQLFAIECAAADDIDSAKLEQSLADGAIA